jgi:hypothetical protein
LREKSELGLDCVIFKRESWFDLILPSPSTRWEKRKKEKVGLADKSWSCVGPKGKESTVVSCRDLIHFHPPSYLIAEIVMLYICSLSEINYAIDDCICFIIILASSSDVCQMSWERVLINL